ncbi:MAG: HIT family protein [Candidatus Nanoarchaeia archaeon]
MVTEEELKNMSPEEIAELQKKNCIFCKIISGEIPSIKVYETKKSIAILDINPAKPGHVLLMPKEHIPILPIVPPDVFTDLFKTAQLLAQAMKKALLVQGVSIVIANGAVAGQQAPHFLFHLIPREKGDGLDMLTIAQNEKHAKEQVELLPAIQHNLPLMLENHFKRLGGVPKGVKPKKEKTPTQESKNQAPIIDEQRKEAIAQLLEQNPDARKLLKENPEEFKKQIMSNPQTKEFFEGINIDALSEGLNTIEKQASSKKNNDKKPSEETIKTDQLKREKKPKSPKAQVFLGEDPYAQKEKVFAYFEEKPQARKVLMKDVKHFKKLLAKREDVQVIFKDVNIDKLSEKLNEAYASKEKSTTIQKDEKLGDKS